MKISATYITACAVLLATSPLFAWAATIADLQAQIAVLQAQAGTVNNQVSSPAGAAPAKCSVSNWQIVRNLSRGARGNDVRSLQWFLIAEGYLASDLATGFFGALTEKAVQQWQLKNGIASSGTPATTGYGAVGPRTKMKIAATCTAPPTPSQSVPAPSTPQSPQTGPTPESRTQMPRQIEPTPNPQLTPIGTSILQGSFDPVVWMNATKGAGVVKTYGELWDDAKKTWIHNGVARTPKFEH